MTKNLRTVKASLILGILLFSLIAAFIPSTSAGLLKNNATIILEPEDPQALNDLVVPLEGPMSVGIKIGYLVSGVFASAAIQRFESMQVPAIISLEVDETPSWATATIEPNVVTPKIKLGYSYANATLKVSFKEDAPARGEVVITVRMRSDKISIPLFQINAKEQIGTITFTPDFLPIISVKPLNNFQEISPGEIATFDIEIENMGNAKTSVDFEILTFPEDWSPNIISSITIAENSKKTVQLVIQPPYGFGYHNVRETIQIRVTPSYFADPSLTGRIYIETFTIQSRGFSTPGFEAILVFIALIGIAIIMKKQRKLK